MQDFSVLPGSETQLGCADGVLCDLGDQAPCAQDAGGVGRDLDAGADLGAFSDVLCLGWEGVLWGNGGEKGEGTYMVELGGLLKQRDGVPCASDADCGGQATEACTDDGDVDG